MNWRTLLIFLMVSACFLGFFAWQSYRLDLEEKSENQKAVSTDPDPELAARLEEKLEEDWKKFEAKYETKAYEKFRSETGRTEITDEFREQVRAEISELRRTLPGPPFIPDYDIEKYPYHKYPFGPIYEGEQTVEGIMAEFDEWYVDAVGDGTRADQYYPRAEWIQMLLNRGVTFKDRGNYSALLEDRWALVHAKDKPSYKADLSVSYRPTNDSWEALEDAYIEGSIKHHRQYMAAKYADPENVIGGFSTQDGEFIPNKKNTVYVKLKTFSDEVVGAIFYGQTLTEKQEHDIMYHRKGPEGIEVIYLDTTNSSSFLELSLDEEHPQSGTDFEPSPSTPPSEVGAASPDFPRSESSPKSAEQNPLTSPNDTERSKHPPAQFEAFLRDFEKFSKMTDDEIEAELAKQATSQVPTDERLETELQERVDPQRFSKAMATLRQYGREEGLRRLAEKDPAFAEHLQRFLERQRK